MTPPPTPYPSAARTSAFVGQDDKLEQIRQSLARPGTDFRLLLIRAPGGMGKSRLLEEVMTYVDYPDLIWAKANKDDTRSWWKNYPGDQRPVVSAPIDVIDTRLHDRNRFIAAVHESLRQYPGVTFPTYRRMEEKLLSRSASGAQLTEMREAQQDAANAFVDDLGRVATKRRVGILVDTVERLSYPPLDRLRQLELLSPDQFQTRVHVWLETLIADRQALQNVTLILAGRAGEKEGEYFFRLIADAAARHGIVPQILDLEELSEGQVEAFYEALKEETESRSGKGTNYGHVASHFRAMADRAELLHFYTKGIPVRLSLYGQIIIDGGRVPHLLTLGPAEARRRAPAGLETEEEQNDWVRWQIEDRFALEMTRLAEHRLEDARTEEGRDQILRARVLQALVRAPRGLTAEQLHFALDNADDTPPPEWRADPNRLQEYIKVMREIEQETYLGKRRSSWEMFTPFFSDVEPIEATGYRVGLQDEIYRVYAEHMGPTKAPLSSFAERMLPLLSENERSKYETRLAEESAARRDFYRRLAQWADWRHGQLVAAKSELLRQDEAEFERDLRFDERDIFEFRKDDSQVVYRASLNAAIAVFEIERMVYQLLEDPEWTLNTSYITLEDDNDKAAREEEDFLAQAEMLRAINDDFLMKFVSLTERTLVTARGDKPIDVMRRVAEQENASRWIKRLVLRGKYEDALEFADRLEEYINSPEKFVDLSLEGRRAKPPKPGALPGAPTEYEYRSMSDIQPAWNSWRHAVATSERLIWRNVAVVRRGGTGPAADEIKRLIKTLRKYYETPRTQVFDLGDRLEYGFRADPDAEDPANRSDHPGRVRLKRMLSHAYNTLGYANSRRGEFQEAIRHYMTALAYAHTEDDLTRPPQPGHAPAGQSPEMGLSNHQAKLLNNVARAHQEMPMPAHQGQVLNNAARAHSETGNPATEMCLHALRIRRELAEEVPLAGSLNTLALIYDDLGRYEDAPVLSAKAVAYCRRAGESRQQALSLRQLAESLRHLADRMPTGQRAAAAPEGYYTVAAGLLAQANVLFHDLGESDRLLEVVVEQGSLNYSRMENRLRFMGREEAARRRRPYAADSIFEDFRKEAVNKLTDALHEMTDDTPHLALNARVILARIHALDERYHRRLAEAAPEDPTGRTDPMRETAAADQARAAADDLLNGITQTAGEYEFRTGKRMEKLADMLPRLLDSEYTPTKEEHPGLRNRAWVFRHLARAELARGRLALDDFERATDGMKESEDYGGYLAELRRIAGRLASIVPEAGDEVPDKPYATMISRALADAATTENSAATAQAAARAAEAFALALRYSELFWPGSRLVAGVQNAFYERAHTYHYDELALLDQAFLLVGRSAPYNGRVATFTLLRDFLPQYFGYGWLDAPAGDEGDDHD